MSGPHIATQLAAYIAELPREAFSWPANNCCHFFARWVERATGRNPMAGLPATPDARSAWRLIRALGADLEAAVTARMGVHAMPATLAQTGDPVLVPLRTTRAASLGGAAMGICSSRQVILYTFGAAHFAPLDRASRAWRLPC